MGGGLNDTSDDADSTTNYRYTQNEGRVNKNQETCIRRARG